MRIIPTFSRVVAVAGLLAISPGMSAAPAPTVFKGRLSPVPVDIAMLATVSGSGTVSATLNDAALTIDGTFDGLKSPATVARVHIGRKGVRGPAFFDLKVANAPGGTPHGTVGGVLQLTPLQVDALLKGSFYVQLHSEKAPDGNLWGWLAPAEIKR